MTHTLELSESVERVLEAKAQQRGIAVDAYLLDLVAKDAQVKNDAREPQHVVAARLQSLTQLRELAQDTRAGLPPIPDEALTSENLYAGRGEIL